MLCPTPPPTRLSGLPVSGQRLRHLSRAQVSWVAELHMDHPGAEFVFGVSPVLAGLRSRRRTAYVLFVQSTMDMSKRKVQSLAQCQTLQIRRIIRGRHAGT